MTKAKDKMKTGGNAVLGRWPVMVRLDTFKRLKAMAAKRKTTAAKLAEEIISAGLKRKALDSERFSKAKPKERPAKAKKPKKAKLSVVPDEPRAETAA